MNILATEREKRKEISVTNNGHILRFKKIMLLGVLITCGLITTTNMAKAQENNLIDNNFSINLDLKNMHLWHGSVVTPGAMIASAMEYNSTNQKFTVGLWGGASFNGDYKEFSYYTTYRFTTNFNASLISHNNYSNAEAVNIFSYDKYTSPNFVDIVLEYTVSKEVPLTFYWSTILFGNGGDYETNTDGAHTNSFSNYAEIRYTFFQQQKTQLSIFAGGAFSFATEKTFYSESANITNLGLTLSRDINILSQNLPVSATAFWNPETKVGALQLAISLF